MRTITVPTYAANGVSQRSGLGQVYPDPPAPPSIGEVRNNSVTVNIPSLPANATAMDLQISTNGTNFQGVRYNLAGGGQQVVPADKSTDYWFRVVAFNTYGGTRHETASGSAHARTPETQTLFAPTLEFSITPPGIPQGQSATIRWNTTNADEVFIQDLNDASTGTKYTQASGSATIRPQQTTTYRAQVIGGGGTATINRDIVVGVPDLQLSFNPASVQRGATAKLTWVVKNASSVNIPGVGQVTTSGNKDLVINQNTQVTGTASNLVGSVNKTAMVSVIGDNGAPLNLVSGGGGSSILPNSTLLQTSTYKTCLSSAFKGTFDKSCYLPLGIVAAATIAVLYLFRKEL